MTASQNERDRVHKDIANKILAQSKGLTALMAVLVRRRENGDDEVVFHGGTSMYHQLAAAHTILEQLRTQLDRDDPELDPDKLELIIEAIARMGNIESEEQRHN